MADNESSTEQSVSAIGLAVNDLLRQVKAAGVSGVKVEFTQNDDEDNSSDDWAQDEEAYDDAIRQIESVDLTQDDDTILPVPGGEPTDESLRCAHSEKGTRNPCLCGTHELVNTIPHPQQEIEVKVGKLYALDIEIRVGRYHIDFIEVLQIWEHRRNGSIIIRGFAYARTRNLDGRLQAYQNELCRIIEVDSNDHRSDDEQSLIEVVVEDLRPQIRILHQTNKPFPECRFDPKAYATKEERENRASLTCRWVLAMLYPDKRFRRAQRPVDGEWLASLTEASVPKKRHRADDDERRHNWRGETHKGGSYNVKSGEDAWTVKAKDITTRRPRYNAADMFSGAGGYTTGATSAGIKVERAVDHWVRCNTTYKANHPDVDLYEVDIMEYCNDLTIEPKHFDLVHISPPCQVFSPAHTCVGKNDSANIAALSACEHIVFLTRPRIVTFEQTFGIIQERHLPLFNALLQSLTKFGYSLKWKVISLVDYGLPQNRKRLIMIGAAPGEPLPPFPEPTHVAEPQPGDGKRRFVSAVKACWGLVEGQGMHNPSEVKHMERIQWDGTQPMNRTITTSGGQAYHWEGERDLTLAEFARLQGFPEGYIFKAPCIKKQIGNAFPPIVVTAIMRQLVSWLEAVDGMSSGPDEEQIVAIEDDDGTNPYDCRAWDDWFNDGAGGDSLVITGVKQEGVITIDDDSSNDGYQGGDHEHSAGSSGSGGGAGLFSHERLTAPNLDATGSSEHIEDVNANSPCRGGQGDAGSPGRSCSNAPDFRSSMEPDLVAMSPEQRALWVAQFPRRYYPRRRSSSRRQSSASLILTGERRLSLAAIKEDEDDDTAGQGSSSSPVAGGHTAGGSTAQRSRPTAGQTSTSSAQGVSEDDDDSSSSSGNFDPNDIQRFDVPEHDNDEHDAPLLTDPPTPPRRPVAPGPEGQYGHGGSRTLGTQHPSYGIDGGGGTFPPRSAATRYSAREIANMDEDELAGVLGIYDDGDECSGSSQPQATASTHASLRSPPSGRHDPDDSADRPSSGPSEEMWGHPLERDWDAYGHSHGRPGSARTGQADSMPLGRQQTDFSDWQDDSIAEDDAMAAAIEESIAMEMNMRDAIQRNEQAQEEEVDDGGKGKGKAVAKRSFRDGADDTDSGSPAKRSRTK